MTHMHDRFYLPKQTLATRFGNPTKIIITCNNVYFLVKPKRIWHLSINYCKEEEKESSNYIFFHLKVKSRGQKRQKTLAKLLFICARVYSLGNFLLSWAFVITYYPFCIYRMEMAYATQCKCVVEDKILCRLSMKIIINTQGF